MNKKMKWYELGPTEIEEFESKNSFHLKTLAEQTQCYIDRLVSLMQSPIEKEKDMQLLTLASKTIFQDPKNRAKVNNFHKYVKTTFHEYELNIGKLFSMSPRHGALAIVYICSSLSLLGLTHSQVYKLLGLTYSSRSLSSMSTYVQMVVDNGCTEWFKETLEWREWDARQKWKEAHPNYRYNVNENNPNRQKDQEHLNKIFRMNSKSPYKKRTLMTKKINAAVKK